MEFDTRFASTLDSVHDAPEPLRGALLEKLPSRESIRLLIHAPGVSMREQEPPIAATLLAVTSEGWFVVSESEEDHVSVEKCTYEDTLFLELTSILLWAELKIHFASVGTSYTAAMRFSTVTEEPYREAIDLVLDRIDQRPAQARPEQDEDSASMFVNWPIEFRTEALRYRPKWQRILAATQWPAVVGAFGRALCPAGALLVTERELVLISQGQTSPRLHTTGFCKVGGTIIYFPYVRLSDFHVSHQERFGVLALEAHAKHGGERLEIMFPADYENVVSEAIEKTFAAVA
jgi:hypothetical protein